MTPHRREHAVHARPHVPRSDAALVRAMADGDLGALGELYDRYARAVWRTVHRVMRGGADVEDVVHSVFLKLPEIARSYDGRDNARAWLLGISVRFALRHRRGAGRFLRMLVSFGQAAPQASEPESPERRASEREQIAALEAALARLAPKKRAVFVLVELEGLSREEVASALRIPVATVRTRLHHARHELQSALRLGAIS